MYYYVVKARTAQVTVMVQYTGFEILWMKERVEQVVNPRSKNTCK